MAEKNSLWKNIRNKAKENRASGATPKKPTTEMLRQERKIRAKKADGGYMYPNGGLTSEMPLGLPLKEHNPYLVPEYNQPMANGYILPDPNRPQLMNTGATEYKDSHNVNGKKVQVPSIVAGQYLGEPDKSLYRYMISGEEFKPMADPGSYSKFYDMIEPLGLMKDDRTYAAGGPGKKPIYVSNPNDPRIQMYNDSLDLNQGSIQDLAVMIKSKSLAEQKKLFQKEGFSDKMFKAYRSLEEKNSVPPEPYKTLRKEYDDGAYKNYLYKKPTQPYIYKKSNLSEPNKKTTLKKETTTPQLAEYRNFVEIEKLNPLKLTAIPTEEIPLALTPFPKQKAYINRGANSGFDANGNPLVSEVNLGNGWQQVPYNTLGDYEEIKAQGGYYPTQGPGKALFKGYADGGPARKPKPTYLTPEQLGTNQEMQSDATTSNNRSLEDKIISANTDVDVKIQKQKELNFLNQERINLRKFLDSSTGSLQNWNDRENAMKRLVEIDNKLGTRSLEEEIKVLNKAGQIMLKAGKYLAPPLFKPAFNVIDNAIDAYQYVDNPNIQNAASLQMDMMQKKPFGVIGDVYDTYNIVNEKATGGYTNPYNQYQDDPYLNYAGGGYMYGNGGRTLKNIGAGAFGLLEGLVDTTFGYIPGVDMATDLAYKGLQKLGKSTEDEKREQDSIAGYAQTAGAVGSAILTGGATTGTAIAEGAQGLGQGISKGNETSDVAKGIGTGLNIAGTVVGAAYGNTKGAKEAKSAFKLSEAGSQGLGRFAAAAPISGFSAAPKGTMQGVIDGNAVSMKPGTDAALSSVTPTASVGTFSTPNVTNINAPNPIDKIADVTSAISSVPKSQEPPPMAPPVPIPQLPPSMPQVDYGEFQINTPEINTGFEAPNYDFGYDPTQATFSQGGNITNNSLNLRNTMRYKRFAQGGTFDQYGINMIPKSAGLHHQSAYGGVPIGPDALAEGGEIKMDTGDGGQYIVSDQVDGAETQKDFTFSKGGKYKELNRTLADGMKQDLNKYSFGSLATSDRVKGDLRRPNDSYAQNTIDQIKQKWQQKTEYARQRSQQEQAIAQAEEQKRMAEEQYVAAYGGKINPKKYPGLNYAKGGIHIKPENKGKFTASAKAAGHSVQEHAKAVLNNPNATPLQKKRANFARNAAKWKHDDGGYVYNPMTQPMLAIGGPLYGDPASEYTYAIGGMYGDPYARGGQIDYTNDMYSMYAGGGPMVGNAPQAFTGYAAQNRGGMLMNYADGGMMPQDQQMMQEQQMMQQAPQEQMPQQGSEEQMMQMVQQVMQAIMQGTPPEQIMQQLIQSGVPQEQAQQIIQVAMQEAQSQQQQQPMQGQEQMMPPQQGMMASGGRLPKDVLRARVQSHMSAEAADNYVNNYSRGGMMYASGGEDDKDYEYSKPRVTRKKTEEFEVDDYEKEKKIYEDRMNTYQGVKSFNKELNKAIASSNRPFNSHSTFKTYMQNLYDKYNIVGKYTRPVNPITIKHPIGNNTTFTSDTADEPMVKPTLRMRELQALKANLSQDYTPTITDKEQPLSSVVMPTPRTVYVDQVNQPGYGVTAENNPAFNYDAGVRINLGDKTGYKNIPTGTYKDETNEVYPSYLHYLASNNDEYNLQGNIPQSVTDWAESWRSDPKSKLERIKPSKTSVGASSSMPTESTGTKDRVWDDKGVKGGSWLYYDKPEHLEKIDAIEKAKRSRATGGMVNPQDGVATQIAQELQQGADPQQVLQSLVKKGMPQQQAMAMLQAVMGQLKTQQQPQQQMMPQQQMAPQPMMAARGGYFNNKKQYDNGGFSPLADESTMSQIAGLGQAVVPALTSAFAFNKLSKRKLAPSLVENVNIDYTPERINMQEENRRNLASGLNTMRNVAPTSGSYMGNVRGAVLDANKLSGQQISKSWQDQKNKQAEYDYSVGSANAGIRNKVNETNEEMYQNAMQTGFQAAGQGVKNAASYYGDLENRKLQRWQAMNTSGEDWHWTPKGKAFRNKDGKWYINGKEVESSSGNPI